MLNKRFLLHIGGWALMVLGLLVAMLGLAAARPAVRVQGQATGYDLTKTITYPSPSEGGAFVGESLTVTLTFKNPYADAHHLKVQDNNPAPTYLRILTETISAGAVYSPTVDAVIWKQPLDGNTSATVTFQMLIIGGSGQRVANEAWLYDREELSTLPNDVDTAEIHILARIYLPLVVRNYPPPPAVWSWHPGAGTVGAGWIFYSLSACPDNADVLYAGTRDQGVYKSTDRGKNWQATTLDGPSTGGYVWGVAVQRGSNCQTVYATTWGHGVRKTVDGGGNWGPVNAGLGDLYLYALVIDPNNNQVLYVGTASSGIYKSTNAGGSWAAVNTGLPPNTLVDALIVDPTNSQVIYAGTWGAGVWKSTNGGGSWSAVNNGLGAASNIYALAIDPTNAQVLYAATYLSGVYRSQDGGGTWAQEVGVPSGAASYAVTVDPTGVAYAGLDGTTIGNSVYQRSIAGSWAAMPKQPGVNLQVRNLTLCDFILLAATNDGVWWYGPD